MSPCCISRNREQSKILARFSSLTSCLHVEKIPWEEEIVGEKLKKECFYYFEMLSGLDQIKFNHCVKPISGTEDPSSITFSDDNPDGFGVCSYILYDLEDGSKSTALMMAKAKLGPLTHKGETVKNELCVSVLALRMKIWLIQESGVFFKEHHHFVDSMIVKEMIKKVFLRLQYFFWT